MLIYCLIATNDAHASNCLQLINSISSWLALINVNFLVCERLSSSSSIADHLVDDGLDTAGLRTGVVLWIEHQCDAAIWDSALDEICTVAYEKQWIRISINLIDVVIVAPDLTDLCKKSLVVCEECFFKLCTSRAIYSS